MASTAKTVVKPLIEYNINNLKEADEEGREAIDIEFTEQNAYPKKLWNAIHIK